MNRFKVFAVLMCVFVSLGAFSYSSTNRMLEENETSSSLINKWQDDADLLRSIKDDEIVNHQHKVTANKSFGSRDIFFEFTNSAARVSLGYQKINVMGLDVENLKRVSNQIDAFKKTSYITSGLVNRKSSFGINIDFCPFLGLDMSPNMCRTIYQQMVMMTDRFANHYLGILDVLIASLNYSAPTFVAKCTSLIMREINAVLSIISSIGGPYRLLVHFLLGALSFATTSTILYAFWAGHHNKGFKIGFKGTQFINELYG